MTPQKIMSNIIPTLTPKHWLTIFQLSVKASTFTFPKPISRIRAHFVDNNVKLDKTSPKHGTVRYSTNQTFLTELAGVLDASLILLAFAPPTDTVPMAGTNLLLTYNTSMNYP